MAAVEQKIEVFEVDYVCDECGQGKMRPTGIALTSYPPKYVHRCEKCDCNQNFSVIYPTTAYRKSGQ